MTSRRQVLASLGTGATIALAGCSDLLEQQTASYPEELDIITETDGTPFHAGSNTCTSREEGEVTITQSPTADNRANYEGVIITPTPCHVVEIAGAEYDAEDGTAILRISAEEDDSDMCQDCIGAVQYSGAVEFDGGVPRALRIEHVSDADETSVEEEF